jgi:hypothetical protein
LVAVASGLARRTGDALALDLHRALVRAEDPAALRELSLSAAPAGDEEEAGIAHGQRGHDDRVEEPDQDELAVPLLPDIVAQNGGL